MLQHYLFIFSCLLLTVGVKAQNNFCKSSFSFTPATNSTVQIRPIAPASFSQLYDVNGFTWEGWFRLHSNNVNNQLIISVEDAVVFQDIFLGFGFGTIPNALSFHISDNGTTNAVVSAESLQTFTINTWYHVAAVCDYAGGELRLYLNATLIATKVIPVTILQNRLNQNHPTYIGNASASASTLDGDIDEVRFWNTVRTQAQLQQNLTQCMTMPQTGLIAYFKADETQGNASNSVVNGNYIAYLANAGWSTQYPGDTCYSIGIAETVISCKTLDFQGSVTNAIPVASWQWNFDDGNTGAGQTSQHGYATFGSRDVKLILTDNQGCKDSVTKKIDVQSFNIYKDIDTAICAGASYEGYTSTGVYTTTIPAPDGCDTLRTINLTVFPKDNTIIDTTVCDGVTVAGYSLTGTYTDQFTSVYGCDSTRTLNLTVLPIPKLFIGKDTVMCTGDSILLDAGVFDTYRWQDGSAGRYVLVKQPGKYTVTVTSACVNAVDDIFIQESSCNVDFPTAFSPNGDNRNDVFKILNARRIKEFHLVIFNRWGQKVFETKNAQQGWDGKINGKQAGTETYIWYCEFLLIDQPQRLTRKGIVALIK